MIDEKDIEIAKLKGQVEALEKMVRTLITLQPQPVAPPIVVPQIVPPLPAPWIPPYEPPMYGPDLYRTTSVNPLAEMGTIIVTNAPGLSS